MKGPPGPILAVRPREAVGVSGDERAHSSCAAPSEAVGVSGDERAHSSCAPSEAVKVSGDERANLLVPSDMGGG